VWEEESDENGRRRGIRMGMSEATPCDHVGMERGLWTEISWDGGVCRAKGRRSVKLFKDSALSVQEKPF